MFADLFQLIAARNPSEDARNFIDEVRVVDHAPARNPRTEKLLLVCWLAIALKCVVVTWLVAKYQMPFSPLWVNAPTVFFGLACTGLYFGRAGR